MPWFQLIREKLTSESRWNVKLGLLNVDNWVSDVESWIYSSCVFACEWSDGWTDQPAWGGGRVSVCRLLQRLAALSWNLCYVIIRVACSYTGLAINTRLSSEGIIYQVLCTIDNLLGTNQMICFTSDWITIWFVRYIIYHIISYHIISYHISYISDIISYLISYISSSHMSHLI